jgi:hypothetical protein
MFFALVGFLYSLVRHLIALGLIVRPLEKLQIGKAVLAILQVRYVAFGKTTFLRAYAHETHPARYRPRWLGSRACSGGESCLQVNSPRKSE